jgi:hypothetical protein
LLLLALAVVSLQAQEPVWLAGWVQWAAATRMQVMTESGVSVAVGEIGRDSGRGSSTQSP